MYQIKLIIRILNKKTIMLKLNLIKPHQSDITYKTLIFPDGQPHIVLNSDKNPTSDPQNPTYTEGVHIIARVANPTDLFTVLMAKDVLDAHEFEHIDLTITYLMAARMDRQMTEGEPFSLRIVARMLNQAGFRSISIFDPDFALKSDW
jgi:ribose-phosphate pyrophosphokinase